MTVSEIVNIGLSESGNAKLDDLKERGLFAEKMDAYRFAVALALAQGAIGDEISKRMTFLHVGSLDPDQRLKIAVEALLPSLLEASTPYRVIERLADWGVNELYQQAQNGAIDFEELFGQVERANA